MISNKKLLLALALVLAFAFLALAANAEAEQRQLGSHEHGMSKLKIAIEGNDVQMELESPGMDIVGFENVAESKSQKAAVQKALAQLTKPLEIFNISQAAGCSISTTKAEYEIEGHDENEAAGNGHAEFHIIWNMTCSKPSALAKIGTRFFELFPDAKEIEIEAISDKGQTHIELENGATDFDLSPVTG